MIDYRARQSPVVDQGHRGICAACAVTAAHEWCLGLGLSIEDAHWNGKQRDPWRNEEATSIAHILPALTDRGHADEATWPLNAPAWPGPPPAESRLPANRRATPNWRRLDNPSPARIHAELAQRVVVLGLDFVPSAWDWGSPLVHAENGEKPVLGHAVLAVGEAQYDGHNAVMIRNSWGTRWGDRGFGYVSDTYLRHYLRSAYSLECANLSEAA